MAYDPMGMLKEFHDKFDPDGEQRESRPVTWQLVDKRAALITEEFLEVDQELIGLAEVVNTEYWPDVITRVAKELADLLYVVYGTAEEFGIPMEAVFKAVHESNMSKVWDDGKVHYRSDGKVLKPPTYKAPDIASVLYGDNT